MQSELLRIAEELADWLDELSLESEWIEQSSMSVQNMVILSRCKFDEAKRHGYEPSPEVVAAWDTALRNSEKLLKLNARLGELVAERRRAKSNVQCESS